MAALFRRSLLRVLAVPAAAAAAAAVGLPSSDCQASGPRGLATVHPPTVVTKKREGSYDIPTLTLEYFALRGLGELPRLILEATDTPYNSVFHFSWPGEGAAPAYRKYALFGQLPVLRDGSLILCESTAICKHLARKTCIDGVTMEEKAKVDMYFELAKDIEGKKVCLHDDAHKDWPKLKRFLDAGEQACDGKFFVGSALTLADVAMFKALHTFSELKPGCLADYPKLSQFVGYFASQPSVAAYLDSARRVPLTANEIGDKPWQPNGYEFLQPLRVGTYEAIWDVSP